jgi:transcriptional regulator with XRE-family HTH domain
METRLKAFMKQHGITILRLATMAELNENTVRTIRAGQTDPRRPTMVQMARGASAILRRKVSVTELFDLGDE